MKHLWRIGLLFAALAFLAAPAGATTAGICTGVTVGTSVTQVLPAYTGSAQNARRRMQVQITTNPVTTGEPAYAFCAIGGAPALNIGYMLIGAGAASSTVNFSPATVWDVPPVQYPASTFPMIPSGALNCIASAASQTITACTW